MIKSESVLEISRTVKLTDFPVRIDAAVARGAVALVKIYSSCVSPLVPSSCIYHPSCSQYSLESFREHGFLKGLKLTCSRLLRCHPFEEGGFDPVPEKRKSPAE